MIYKPYDLSFPFDPIGSATGFLIPVFLEQSSVDKFAVQIIGRDGIVSSFSRVELEDAADLISTKNCRTLYIGDSLLYAFRCHLEEITVGNKIQVSSYPEENLTKFKK